MAISLLSPAGFGVACFAVLVAAVLRGFTGFGFALAAVPLLSLLWSPTQAVVAVTLMQAIVGVYDLVRMRAVMHRPSLRWLALGALFGTPLGLYALARFDASVMRVLIAGIVGVALLVLARKPVLAAIGGPKLAIPAGFFAGVFSGAAAMPGPPVIAYYLSAPAAPAMTRASLLAFFFFTAIIALPGQAYARLIDGPAVLLALVGLPIMVGGTALGAWLFARASQDLYRRIALAVLAVMALVTGLRGIAGLLS
ncbi:sulfite exporter TauE/SafE family protein [Consotaella aegiceratis]|uniref:sulfite exporter TauE/SafE family protein n=1 Tax=Consotaella aegiceratis TaxID=3097961 RepID=UPI002F3EAA6E